MITILIIFVIILISMTIGFYVGLRSQKGKIQEDVTNTQRAILSSVKKLKPKDKAGIIKAWPPERFEQEYQKKFEEENY